GPDHRRRKVGVPRKFHGVSLLTSRLSPESRVETTPAHRKGRSTQPVRAGWTAEPAAGDRGDGTPPATNHGTGSRALSLGLGTDPCQVFNPHPPGNPPAGLGWSAGAPLASHQTAPEGLAPGEVGDRFEVDRATRPSTAPGLLCLVDRRGGARRQPHRRVEDTDPRLHPPSRRLSGRVQGTV